MGQFVEKAQERLVRAPEHTLTDDIPGLLPPQHLADIMDIIDGSRPVVSSARSVPLGRGQLTYPKIAQRPAVLLQSTEKTEGGTQNMQVDMETINADTYIGGGNLSWQAMNWSTPDALQLWFSLAAEAYARETEEAACDVLEGAAIGTVGTASGRLGTAGTESFAQWRTCDGGGYLCHLLRPPGGRARTDTLYLSADRFFSARRAGHRPDAPGLGCRIARHRLHDRDVVGTQGRRLLRLRPVGGNRR